MPLFSTNKFLPKKPPQRKIIQNFPRKKFGDEEDFKFEIGQIKLDLGGQNALFEDGEWIQEGGVGGQRVKDQQKLKQQVLRLQEENNLLKIKNEVLLDMLTETTAEAHLQDKELSRLRQQLMLLKSSTS